MTQQDFTILDKHLKGINLRLIWALVICTAVSVSTVMGVYFGFKTDIAIQKAEMRLMEARIDRIENTLSNKNLSYENTIDKNLAPVMGLSFADNSSYNSNMRMVCVWQDQ